ncbi:MAG: biotin transporter BioY [Armatimonadota bacterium]
MKENIREVYEGLVSPSATASYYMRMALLCSGAAAMTAAAAHIRIFLPFTPVPVTMQTFMVLMAGLALGASAGGTSQALYIAIGALGVPVFAAGIGALAGPTGGYLVGFIIAAAVTGGIYCAHRTTTGAVLACVAGTVVIFASGSLWLFVLTGGTLPEILTAGVLPFLPGAVMKIVAAVLLVRSPITRKAIDSIIPDKPAE